MFDAPVYNYTEGNVGPQKIAETFSEFLDAEIQRMEHLNQTLCLNGGYVLTVNQQVITGRGCQRRPSRTGGGKKEAKKSRGPQHF